MVRMAMKMLQPEDSRCQMRWPVAGNVPLLEGHTAPGTQNKTAGQYASVPSPCKKT
jgi:hypothetical protein